MLKLLKGRTAGTDGKGGPTRARPPSMGLSAVQKAALAVMGSAAVAVTLLVKVAELS